MKKSLATALGIVVLIASGMPLAQDAKSPASHHSPTATQSGSSTTMDSQMLQMDEHMKSMQALHDTMASAATPEERQKVNDAQQREMQACMGLMKQMHSDGTMGSTGGEMMAKKGKPADPKAEMQMMQKRMDMMQMMMQTMMDRQGMTGSPKADEAAPKKS